jgi:hypothetical protein
LQYVEHLENKFEGEIGSLKGKNVQADGLVYIGKESNNTEDQPLDVIGAQAFIMRKRLNR